MKSNNLSLIKIIAAILVIISHAYPLTGANQLDIFDELSKGAITLGGFAVAIFFFSSGFFVTKSIVRRDAKGFWKGRIVRIYPAFATVIFVSVFVMGPLVSYLNTSEYFSNGLTYKYLLYLVMVPVHYLPGVFESVPYSNCVNGALWTIIVEMLCYAGLWIAYKLAILKNKKFINVFSVLFVVLTIVMFSGVISFINPYIAYIRPIFVFIIGMIFALHDDKIKYNSFAILIVLIAFVLLSVIGCINIAMILLFPYMMYCIIFANYQVPESFSKLGDLSYSIYLVAFPIQQLVYYWGIGQTVVSNAVFSIIIAFVVGFVLYKFVEKPCIDRWK